MPWKWVSTLWPNNQRGKALETSKAGVWSLVMVMVWMNMKASSLSLSLSLSYVSAMELSFLNPFGVEVHWDMSLVAHEYIHGSWIVCDFVLYDLGHFNLVIFHNALRSWEGRFLVMLLKIPNNWPNKILSWMSILGPVWYSCLNNSFYCLNNTTRDRKSVV